MLTKKAFFAILNDANNKIGVTAHISVYGLNGGKTALIIKQHQAPNASLSTHKDSANTIQAAFTKYNEWLNEWFTAQTSAAEARINLLEVEAAHTEALAMNTELDEQYASIEAIVKDEPAQSQFKAIAAHFAIGAPKPDFPFAACTVKDSDGENMGQFIGDFGI